LKKKYSRAWHEEPEIPIVTALEIVEKKKFFIFFSFFLSFFFSLAVATGPCPLILRPRQRNWQSIV
jgi:hypothetical protein